MLFRILPGIELAFRVDAFGLLFALGASLLWILTSFYSIGYMRSLKEHAQTRYFSCFALALSATMGVAFSANLFTLFLFYEALTLVTYPLVGHKETAEAKAGARKYVIYLLGAAKVFLLAAIILTYNVAGTLEFRNGGILSAAQLAEHPSLLLMIFALFLFGFAKNALMPLHSWLPAAMVAPTPVSALLHAVAVVKTGVFSTLRVFLFVFGLDAMRELGADHLALAAASVTILVGSLLALGQDNLKARLAFSTVSQLSYIILGAALLNSKGVLGGVAHITQPRGIEDHALLLRRLDLRVHAQNRNQPDVRLGQAHAVDHGRVCAFLAEHCGHSADERIRLQVVSRTRRGGSSEPCSYWACCWSARCWARPISARFCTRRTSNSKRSRRLTRKFARCPGSSCR